MLKDTAIAISAIANSMGKTNELSCPLGDAGNTFLLRPFSDQKVISPSEVC